MAGPARGAEDFLHAWKLDNNTVDSAATRYDGSTIGGVTFVVGKVDQGLSFDGSGYVDIVHPGPLLNQANYTIQAWIYPTTINGLHVIYSEGTPNIVMLLGIEDTKNLVLVVYNQDFPPDYSIAARSQANVITANAWNQVTVTLEGGGVGVGTAKFYVNGVFAGQAPSQLHSLASTQYAAIGDSVGGNHGSVQGHHYFLGIIDDVRLFNRVLATSEVCSGAFKLCGTTCVAVDQCCTDCKTPPSVCYQGPGTCTAGACTFAFADNTPCDADGTKCTANDKCQLGACVVGPVVTCPQLACHEAPKCNPTSGDCESIALSGVTCGGNLCTADGTCTNGICNGTPLADCSKGTTACKVGLCIEASGACGTTSVVNGMPCDSTDKCQLQTACSGGECVGTPKPCVPSSECKQASCDSANGACVEAALPDGTPCDGMNCDGGASGTCSKGACGCGGTTSSNSDGGTSMESSGGCDVGPSPVPPRWHWLVLAMLLAGLARVARRT